jgi:hypothetical protein
MVEDEGNGRVPYCFEQQVGKSLFISAMVPLRHVRIAITSVWGSLHLDIVDAATTLEPAQNTSFKFKDIITKLSH